MQGYRGDREVIKDRARLLPYCQRGQLLGIERHHDRITGLNSHAIASMKPAAIARHDAAIRMHYVDLPGGGLDRHATALIDVIVACEAWVIEVRGGVLHLAEHHDLLL